MSGCERTLVLTCATCQQRGSLSLLDGRIAGCSCDGPGLAAPELQRLADHLRRMRALELARSGLSRAAEAVRVVATAVSPLFLGLLIIVSLGVGVGSIFLLEPLLKPYLTRLATDVAALLGITLWGALVLGLGALARRVFRGRSRWLPVGRGRCPRCASEMPLPAGSTSPCPVCQLDLPPARGTEIELKGAPIAGALETVASIQLVVIGLALVIGLVTTLIKVLR